ncbi:undecaprenyldiphospho-muramoylpentapeptide beta-N- acetylglucosaminyltransferase [Rhodobacteraceae bacterium THAF1]|uniref:glycosyltransferase n=1 Tax=Palleronia sp. THAF1 TaxID=2587842 RepID=UPI000F3BB0EB|nr:glycosyltransferase [Palleronia sp. THAF1]QFU08731.1 undecaprenyldiphospho-muramoylpentapeptide beta-N- acetylglucosaminyltransferase [Palleronia sp. THAF1]VDC27017.1 undecaprenyldiphospho-muramoylpentapeptide beta-N- acetylglucosaminyltransferase [Rhodobacteraceae bacterium THAF1]
MKDFAANQSPRPIGYFCHHQGRGHAVRAAAIVNALGPSQPVTIFCARTDIFPPLRAGVTIEPIPSLFEPSGQEDDRFASLRTPDTLHCAPVGWPGIRTAMARMAQWFDTADPALVITDVSAEVAQLARICSVPHVAVVQHGDRGDPGHRAAYDGAVGLIAPFHADLAQPEWPQNQVAKTCFAGGLGDTVDLPDRHTARRSLGLSDAETVHLVVSGGGGSGVTSAPLGVAARAMPDVTWLTIGAVQTDWHATEPANLRHAGWVDDPARYIAAADLVISSTGNTTCGQVLRAGKPWIVVPEWRYFDEQVRKAEALARACAALHLPHLPSSAHRWKEAVAQAQTLHDSTGQTALLDVAPAAKVAAWIEGLLANPNQAITSHPEGIPA